MTFVLPVSASVARVVVARSTATGTARQAHARGPIPCTQTFGDSGQRAREVFSRHAELRREFPLRASRPSRSAMDGAVARPQSGGLCNEPTRPHQSWARGRLQLQFVKCTFRKRS